MLCYCRARSAPCWCRTCWWQEEEKGLCWVQAQPRPEAVKIAKGVDFSPNAGLILRSAVFSRVVASFLALPSHGRCFSLTPSLRNSEDVGWSPTCGRVGSIRGGALPSCAVAVPHRTAFGDDLQPWKPKRDTFSLLCTSAYRSCQSLQGHWKGKAQQLGWILVSQGRVYAERWHCLIHFWCNSGGIVHPERI